MSVPVYWYISISLLYHRKSASSLGSAHSSESQSLVSSSDMGSNISRTVFLQEDHDLTELISVARSISEYLLARSNVYHEHTETRQDVAI